MEENLSKKAISKISIKPGMIFDDFIIEELDHIDERRRYIWKSRCITCNAIHCFSTRRLHDNRHVYCREHRKYNEPDISGEIHGFLFVDGLSGKKTNDGYNIWNCHCKVCGNRLQRTYAQIKVTRGQSCGCIRNQKNHDNGFIDMTGKIYNNILVERLSERSTTKDKFWECKCLLCGKEFTANGPNIRKGVTQSCGCIKSRSENIIEDFLNRYNIPYQREKRFIGCVDKYQLPFDFFLEEHDMVIEYDGEFHYIQFPNLGNDLAGQQRRDAIKTKYCEENDIILLRIPYWEKDNIESILTDWLFLNGDDSP